MKKIAIKNFCDHPDYRHVYESQLGWDSTDYQNAASIDPKETLLWHLEFGFCIWFFDTVTQRWYYIHNTSLPLALGRIHIPKDWDGMYIIDSLGKVDHETYQKDCDVLCTYDSEEEFVNNATLNGVPIYEVILRSYIEYIC